MNDVIIVKSGEAMTKFYHLNNLIRQLSKLNYMVLSFNVWTMAEFLPLKLAHEGLVIFFCC